MIFRDRQKGRGFLNACKKITLYVFYCKITRLPSWGELIFLKVSVVNTFETLHREIVCLLFGVCREIFCMGFVATSQHQQRASSSVQVFVLLHCVPRFCCTVCPDIFLHCVCTDIFLQCAQICSVCAQIFSCTVCSRIFSATLCFARCRSQVLSVVQCQGGGTVGRVCQYGRRTLADMTSVKPLLMWLWLVLNSC